MIDNIEKNANKRGIESTARNLLRNNIDIGIIADSTGLSQSKIKTLM